MTSSVIVVRADTVAPTPWRNGGGCTRELLRRPAANDWQLRVSLADIERDGPFSVFLETRRWFAVVAGAGVALRFDGHVQTLTPDSDAFEFDGACAPACSLIDGATRDLNLMVGGGVGTMQRIDPEAEWDSPYLERGLFTLTGGTLQTGSQPALPLDAFTLVWHIGPLPCSFAPRAPGRPGWWLGWTPGGTPR
jgi:environmental stress-induced protein Ves